VPAFRTWLVINESANTDLVNLANSLGLWAKLDFTARPPITLSMRGDTAVLSSPNPRDLFSLALYASQQPRQRLLAMSSAPAADLRRMHGRVFFAAAMHIQVSLPAAQTTAGDTPYARRLVELRFLASELQRGFETGATEVVDTPTPQGDGLYLEPLPLVVDDGPLRLLLSDHARSLSLINWVLLPPIRDACPGTYFAAELRDTRATLARVLGVAATTPRTPSALAVWRMMDDALLRDVLLDGGGIAISNEDGEPTGVSVNVWGEGQTQDVLAEYRARVLLQPSEAPGPAWAKALAGAVAADVGDTLAATVALRVAAAPVSWDASGLPRPFDPGGREAGTWQRLQDVGSRLDPKVDREAAKTFQERVLFASRPRPGSHADHDLAEREMIRHLWRTPWAADPDPAWRTALLDLLKTDLGGAHLSPEQRVESWQGAGHFEYRPMTRGAEVLYPGSASSEDTLRWRLTLPLGTVLKPNAQIRLDDTFSTLDRGYQLA